jgi:predicted CopG family antitoxin
MVKVITIMDDVYSELYKLKKAKGLSFTGAIRYLLTEKREEGKQIMSFAGSIGGNDINNRVVERVRRERMTVK